MKPTLEQLKYYFDAGLKFDTPDGIKTLIGIKHNTAYFDNGFCEIPLRKEMPIYRPMSDLCKPITIEGEEKIPLVELAKLSCQFEVKEHEAPQIIEEYGMVKSVYVNMLDDKLDKVVWCLEYNFHYNSFLADPCCISEGKCDQLALFAWLFKHKFDVFNGIGTWAIDCNTLTENIY